MWLWSIANWIVSDRKARCHRFRNSRARAFSIQLIKHMSSHSPLVFFSSFFFHYLFLYTCFIPTTNSGRWTSNTSAPSRTIIENAAFFFVSVGRDFDGAGGVTAVSSLSVCCCIITDDDNGKRHEKNQFNDNKDLEGGGILSDDGQIFDFGQSRKLPGFSWKKTTCCHIESSSICKSSLGWRDFFLYTKRDDADDWFSNIVTRLFRFLFLSRARKSRKK